MTVSHHGSNGMGNKITNSHKGHPQPLRVGADFMPPDLAGASISGPYASIVTSKRFESEMKQCIWLRHEAVAKIDFLEHPV